MADLKEQAALKTMGIVEVVFYAAVGVAAFLAVAGGTLMAVIATI